MKPEKRCCQTRRGLIVLHEDPQGQNRPGKLREILAKVKRFFVDKNIEPRKVVAVVLFAFFAGFVLYFYNAPPPAPAVSSAEYSAPLVKSGWDIARVKTVYEVGKLSLTTERQNYQSGQMRLIVPVLGVDVPVQAGWKMADLDISPGLYEYSLLPQPYTNAHVCIFGHRDTGAMEFYYIDQIGEGDFIYLVYGEKIYVYLYEQTTVVLASDHTAAAVKEYPCVSLFSCEPIGSIKNRIIKTARLVDVVKESESYVFKARELA